MGWNEHRLRTALALPVGDIGRDDCQFEPVRRNKPVQDLTGQQIGYLTVLPGYTRERLVENGVVRGTVIRWRCLCVCGRTVLIAAAALRAGQKSCGCRHRMRSKGVKRG